MQADEFEKKLLLFNPYNHELHEFQETVDELVEAVPEAFRQDLVPAIFRFFERYPLNEHGNPGTLVHLVEKFWPSYEEILLDSLARQPSSTVILMTNRILNAKLPKAKRKKYTEALQQVAASKTVDPVLSTSAQEYLEYQKERPI
jgi:hypothetical protein